MCYHNATTPSRLLKRGYSLIEMIVVVSIVSLLSIGVLVFYSNSQKTMFKTTMKLITASELRNLTAQLDSDGRNADAIILHDGFSGAFRDVIPGEIRDLRLTTGESGEMLIFLYYKDDPTPADKVLAPIDYIVCYAVNPTVTDDDYTPIYRLRVDSTGPTEYLLPEQLLPDTIGGAGAATELARGLVDSHRFYKFGPNSVVFNSAIKNGNRYSTINNIHNFTVTSR